MPQDHEDTYRAAAQRLGAERGLTPEQFIQDAGECLEKYDYPTPDCLSPEDIVAFSTSSILLDQQRRHADTCRFCGPLLQSLSPSPERIADLRRVVTSSEEAPQTVWARAWQGLSSSGWFPAAAMASAVGILVAGGSFFSHSTYQIEAITPKSPAPFQVENLTRQVLASSDVLKIQNTTSSASTEALRNVLTSSSARAYSKVVKVENESKREQQFQVYLLHEMNHQNLVEKNDTEKPPTQVRYQGVEAKFNVDQLFNKLDQKRPEVLYSQ